MGVALGEYELLKRLGAGGMGEVFLARPTRRESRDDDRYIVIKTLLPHLADDESTLTMFLDEARLAARLNHGNVCQIYELGEAGGTWFIAMEYVSGRDCARLLRTAGQRGERFSPEIAARIVSDAAAGLHYSHELTDGDGNHLGLVHRDVSPANILVTYEGGVKLIDFGVAKAAGRVHQTQAGQLKGKISYMSPEQAQGKALDNRSDVFSLGIVLHELLTGRKLFDADGQMEVLWAVCEANVEPPSATDPSLPPELDDVVMKALTLSADDRYSTAQEFRNALERWIITSGRSASPGDVGALVTLLCADDARMERESGPLWDADLSVSEITSIVDPEELREEAANRSAGPFATPPPDGEEQPGGSTALYSTRGFAPEHPDAEDVEGEIEPEYSAEASGDSTMDAATAGMQAYEMATGQSQTPARRTSSDGEDQVSTSITENPLAAGAPTPRPKGPPPIPPPPPPHSDYPSGVEGDSDDDEVELPETSLSTPTSIIQGDSDADGDDDDEEHEDDGETLVPLPRTLPDLPIPGPPPFPPPHPPESGPGGVQKLLGVAFAGLILVALGVGVMAISGMFSGDGAGGEEASTQAGATATGTPTGAPLPTAPKPRIALTVVTDPPGAAAVLDGRPIGQTPILSLPVPPSEKAVLELSRRGVRGRIETIALTKDLEVTYKLVATSVVVIVDSRPPGATVSEGGETLGVTPFEWHAPSGQTASLKFAKKGYRSVEQSVTVQEGAELSAVLKKARSGGGRRKRADRFRPSSSVDAAHPPKKGPKIPTFGD